MRKRISAAILACSLGIASLSGPGSAAVRQPPGRVIVLGVDGLDYELVKQLMARGRMPNFVRLSQGGDGVTPLETTMPAQSPVAWSSFITGEDPGRHAIFDFVHRDPRSMEPYLSTTRTEPGSANVRVGGWQLPLQAGRVTLLRRGTPFWKVLEDHGVNTTIVRMPANFPPSGEATRELSGMGTPDLLGTYGMFSFFTTRPGAAANVSGGTIIGVSEQAGVVRGSIEGPENPYRTDRRATQVPFVAYIDQRREYVNVVIGSEQRLVHVGQWSDWIPVEARLLPWQSLRGECRFYVKSLTPFVELYVTPLNLDPLAPALPLAHPREFATELAKTSGRFYTQGMPADTKSLRSGVLDRDEFLAQARMVRDETVSQYRDVLSTSHEGLLFYYFGHIDQISHMMWRATDPGHPAHTAADDAYASVIEDEYARVDDLVGFTLAKLRRDDLLVVMSDHGFASWRRSFGLNAWLRANGYLASRDEPGKHDPGLLVNIDWSRTKAYGLGLNGLYLNVRGREANGIVPPEKRRRLADEIASKLLATIDPATRQPAITAVAKREDVFRLREDDDIAPDLVIGYAKGTRVSDESATGTVVGEIFSDNRDAWSGDHCMDPRSVPGILLSNRRLRRPAHSLQTLAASLLEEFGIAVFPTEER